MPKLTAAEVDKLVSAGVRTIGMELSVTEVRECQATLKLCYSRNMVRPGGSIGGPVMMTLADAAIYAAILAELGPEVMALTTNMNINFLRRPRESDLTAKANILKMGKRLAIVEVNIFDDRETRVAHVTGTYSLPPRGDVAAASEALAASGDKIDKGLAALQLAETAAADAGDAPGQTRGAAAQEQDAAPRPVEEPDTEELSASDLLALMDKPET